MDRIPDALQFPCQFPIKVFGAAADGFDAQVVSLVRRHVPRLGEGAVHCRHSRGGRYMAVTVTIPATDRAQLDALYRELCACKQVLMVL